MNIWRHGAPDENSHSAAVCNPSISWGSTFTEWADEVLMQYNTYFNLKSNSDKNDNLREREGRKALFLTSLHTSNCVCGNHRKQEFLNSFCEEKHSALLFFSYLLLVLKIAFFLYFFSFFRYGETLYVQFCIAHISLQRTMVEKYWCFFLLYFCNIDFFCTPTILSQIRKIQPGLQNRIPHSVTEKCFYQSRNVF